MYLFAFTRMTFRKFTFAVVLLLSLQGLAFYGSGDSILLKSFHYHAPESSSVFLVWHSAKSRLDTLAALNPESSLNKDMIYTPMALHEGVFTTALALPKDISLYYTFWITRNRQGQYQDFWDRRSAGRIRVTDTLTVVKTAQYTTEKSATSKKVTTVLALAFFALLAVYPMIRRLARNKRRLTPDHRILFTGLSMLVFYGMARAAIIGLPLSAPYSDLLAIPKILKAGSSDFLFIAVFTLVFFLINRLMPNPYYKKVGFWIFMGLATIFTIIAFTNIVVVTYLGRPLNYQWLYYSDFLGSEDAISAFTEQFTGLIAIALLAAVIAMFLLSGVLARLYSLLPDNSRSRKGLLFLTGSLMLVILFATARVTQDWPSGKKENAVISLAGSWLRTTENPSFFSMKPAEDSTFPEITPTKIPFQKRDSAALIKNVLFIVLESAGAQYLDGYLGGYQLSPNLNHYQDRALKVNNAYAHAPGTNRSMVSLLGSIYPKISFRSITQEHPDIDHPTISSILHEKGYRTAFFSSADLSFQNSSGFLAHRGFDLIQDYRDIPCQRQFELSSKDYHEGNGIDDLCLAEHFGEWLDINPSKNFFSVLWTVQGHYPYYYEGEEKDFGVSDITFNRYLNILAHYDKLVGRVMEILSERGLENSTLVVVTGDHGEVFGQHQQYGHGTNIYEENLRVPLYFINDGFFRGQELNGLASLIDVPSTALALMGMEIPPSWQGHDLLREQPGEMFFFAPWSDYLFGYRKDGHKFIFNESDNTTQMFNLEKDPEELSNLAGTQTDEQVELARQRVAAWVQQHEAFINKKLGTSTPSAPETKL